MVDINHFYHSSSKSQLLYEECGPLRNRLWASPRRELPEQPCQGFRGTPWPHVSKSPLSPPSTLRQAQDRQAPFDNTQDLRQGLRQDRLFSKGRTLLNLFRPFSPRCAFCVSPFGKIPPNPPLLKGGKGGFSKRALRTTPCGIGIANRTWPHP